MANQEWKRNANETGALPQPSFAPLDKNSCRASASDANPMAWRFTKTPYKIGKFDSTRTAQFFARSAKRGCFPASLIGEVMQTNPADANPIERRFKLCLTIPPI